MNDRFTIFILSIVCLFSLNSCLKQEYFKSEKETKKDLQGSWKLIAIPKYNVNGSTLTEHIETWTFDDTYVTILNNGQTGTSTYSVHTTITKAEIILDKINPDFILPARTRYNGTWQIVNLDNNILIISSDNDGTSGLIQLEFQKMP